jgi:hypothetical protein
LNRDGNGGRAAADPENGEQRSGCIEIRCCLSTQVDWLEQKPEWKDLAAVGRVESTLIIGEKHLWKAGYYLSSFTDLERFAQSA